MASESEAETRNEKPGTRNSKISLYAPVLIWIGVIFFLSSGQGSMARTSLIIRPILEFLFPSAPEETLQLYHGIIRKCAHFTEYAVLGFLACRAFSQLSQHFLRRHFYIVAIALVALVAVSDEFNQSFNPERTSSGIDVLIDLAGGAIAALLYFLRRRK